MSDQNEIVTISIALTREEWCEVANAIASKENAVVQGVYDEVDVQERDSEKWAKTLRSAYFKVTSALDFHGVMF